MKKVGVPPISLNSSNNVENIRVSIASHVYCQWRLDIPGAMYTTKKSSMLTIGSHLLIIKMHLIEGDISVLDFLPRLSPWLITKQDVQPRKWMKPCPFWIRTVEVRKSNNFISSLPLKHLFLEPFRRQDELLEAYRKDDEAIKMGHPSEEQDEATVWSGGN